MANNFKLTHLLFFMLIFPIAALSDENNEPTGKIKVIRSLNSYEAYVGHSYLRKCLDKSNLPVVTLPEISFTTTDQESSTLYTVQFNGIKLNPRLRIKNQSIQLEKTSDKSGYFITLSKQASEKKFDLLFIFTNKNSESIRYDLKIENSQAEFKLRLTEEQMARLCIKDQLWLGLGLSNSKGNQYNNELDADLSYGTSEKSKSANVEYKKYFNSSVGLGLSYRYIPGELKNDNQMFTSGGTLQWQAIEAALLYRSLSVSYESDSALWYPYLKTGIQHIDVPLIHISNAGSTSIVIAQMQQLSLGAGLNIFAKNGFYTDLNLNIKALAASDKISKISQSYEVGLMTSKIVNKNLTLGLGYLYISDQLSYKVSEQNFNNTGRANLSVSTFDLKIGWVF